MEELNKELTRLKGQVLLLTANRPKAAACKENEAPTNDDKTPPPHDNDKDTDPSHDNSQVRNQGRERAGSVGADLLCSCVVCCGRVWRGRGWGRAWRTCLHKSWSSKTRYHLTLTFTHSHIDPTLFLHPPCASGAAWLLTPCGCCLVMSGLSKVVELSEELEFSSQLFHDLSVYCNANKATINHAKDVLVRQPAHHTTHRDRTDHTHNAHKRQTRP